MTPTQLTLLRKVAARMPHLLTVWTDEGLITWKNGRKVMETELLHVAAEFEKGMSEGEHQSYREILWQIVPLIAPISQPPPNSDSRPDLRCGVRCNP